MAPLTPKEKAMKGVEAILERYKLIAATHKTPLYDSNLFSNIKILDADPAGIVTWSLLIDEQYANVNGVMHGGAAGVLLDSGTTIALGPLARPGFWDFLGGVTRTLSISYLRAIPIGTTIHVRSEVLQAGRTMAHIRGTMMSADGKTIYATAEHHKVLVPTPPANLKFRVPWDEGWDGEGREKAKL